MNKRIAIITGASSGLGREYAEQLKENTELDEIWAIARRRERLEKLAAESPVIRPVPLDLTSVEDMKKLIRMLDEEHPDIRILINAAGMGRAAYASETAAEDIDNMIDLNCKAAVRVTAMCLPLMSKGSSVLQIASIAGFQPIPSLAVYAAAKAFLLSYTESLHHELKAEGIHVTAVCPYWVKDTEFISIARQNGTTLFTHTPLASLSKDIVRISLRDSSHNRMISTPGIISSAERIASKILPDSILMGIMNFASKL